VRVGPAGEVLIVFGDCLVVRFGAHPAGAGWGVVSFVLLGFLGFVAAGWGRGLWVGGWVSWG
jgi:hypothetical protein